MFVIPITEHPHWSRYMLDSASVENCGPSIARYVPPSCTVTPAARAALSGPWKHVSQSRRGEMLHRLALLIRENARPLAMIESRDNGKPLKDTLGEMQRASDWLVYFAGAADKINGEQIPYSPHALAYTRREPVGVCGQIIPWNFPMLMTAWKWGPALAAGCTIVMKPAEQTPLTCLRMAEIAQEAGIPDGVINVVPGYGPTAGAAAVKHPGIDKIAFTGEHRTAQIIMTDAAQTLKRLTFELGGKSPNVIFDDADLEAAVAGTEFGLFFNQGQCCCAGSRVFVQESIRDEFIERIVSRAAERKLGNPFDTSTMQGPQVDQDQFDKILSYIEKGRSAGAACLTGGNRFGDKGYFIEPTIFADVTDDMPIATDEIFGPVMSILSFKDESEIIERANNTFYGLAAAVWTRDVGKAHQYAKSVRAGTVWVNCYDVFDAGAPFGGFKMSGIGRELGAAALNNYTELKTVTMSLD